jgi:uncharacterized protein YggE
MNAQSAGSYIESASAGNYVFNNIYNSNREQVNIPINGSNGSTINLKADVMMNVRPTSFTAIFAMSQSGVDVASTDSTMQNRIRQIRYGLNRLGINDEDIHIDAVSMMPTYAYKLEEKKFSKRSVEVPTGLEMKKNIHVLFRSHDMLDPIISEMAYAEVYDLVKVEYNIDGLDTYYDELRKTAMEVLKHKQNTYSDFGFHTTLYAVGDGFNVTYPFERYKSYISSNSGSTPMLVNAGRAEKDALINVYAKNTTINVDRKRIDDFDQQYIIQNADKKKTVFYDRLPYNQFDKVINANTEEPCIQIAYSVQASYTLMSEENWKLNEDAKKLQQQQNAYSKLSRRERRRMR